MMMQSPQNISGYLIGQAAKMSGVSAANIRFYEKEGLIAQGMRSESSYRLYSEQDVHQLRFIRQLRNLDMTLDEVRTLLDLDLRSKQDCQTARDALDEHIGHVRERLKELKALEKNLTDLRQRCNGDDTHCHLIEALHAQAELPLVKGKGKLKKHQPL